MIRVHSSHFCRFVDVFIVFVANMRARLLVFPIKGRNWCFLRSVDKTTILTTSSSPLTLKDLWKKIISSTGSLQNNAELVVDFVSDKVCWSVGRFLSAQFLSLIFYSNVFFIPLLLFLDEYGVGEFGEGASGHCEE